jgi:hypothetical protein
MPFGPGYWVPCGESGSGLWITGISLYACLQAFTQGGQLSRDRSGCVTRPQMWSWEHRRYPSTVHTEKDAFAPPSTHTIRFTLNVCLVPRRPCVSPPLTIFVALDLDPVLTRFVTQHH